MTKQDARDIRRILGRAVLEGREPTEMEVSEALCLKLVRDSLRDGKFTLPLLRKQFGGPNSRSNHSQGSKGHCLLHDTDGGRP